MDVTFDKAEHSTRLVNLKVKVNLPNGECQRREKALLRVAEHCPVHETISTLEGIEFELNGSQKEAESPEKAAAV